MGNKYKSNYHQSYGAERKLQILKQGFQQDVKVVDLCRREDVPLTTYYGWRRQFIYAVLHGSDYEKIRLLTEQKEKLRLENRCLREVLFSMIGGSLSLGGKALPLSEIEPVQWMLRLLSKAYTLSEAENEVGKVTDLATLLQDAKSEQKRVRNYAISILAQCRGIRRLTIARFLRISRSSVYRYWAHFQNVNAHSPDTQHESKPTKATNQKNIAAVFSVLHSPPSEFGINRTSWIMADLKRCLAERNVYLGLAAIRTIIRGAGYTWRRAKVVLTSNDPLYRQKLSRIQAVLSSLREDERFFSIDEFGPFAVKMKAGRRLVAPGEYPYVPQFQKSKGCLIVTAALELSTNQVTHFYSKDKNTDEMIRLLELLLTEYRGCSMIYLSWDAASWHISKKLKQRIYKINSSSYRDKHGTPKVRLMPLPASAQFLNVIESVFSGMARAIIHNSNYGSVDEARSAIDRHFKERNEYFQRHPKAAGMKIWGKEPSKPQFSETNNCKDRRFH